MKRTIHDLKVNNKRKSIIKALKLARPLIKSRFMICYALNNLRLNGQITKTDEKNAKEYIRELIGNSASVLAWLWRQKAIPFGERNNYDPLVIDYRERWIDHMVVELQALVDKNS